MRALATISVLSLWIMGCACIQTRRDSFVLLHGLIKQTLIDSSDCGPISTNQIVDGRYFEVSPRPRGLRVTVSERPFFSQKEWDRRYASGTTLMSQFINMASTNDLKDTNYLIEVAKQFGGITNLFGLSDLPAWRYHNIGVDVSVEEVDVVYPGLQEDNAEAQKRYDEIVKLLRAYRRANKSPQPTPGSAYGSAARFTSLGPAWLSFCR
jgi:hypothetical protein